MKIKIPNPLRNKHIKIYLIDKYIMVQLNRH